MTKVLLTGATGFVGQHLARHLAQQPGIELRCLVRKASLRGPLAGLPIEYVEGDLTDATSLHGVCDGVERVYHSACALQDTFAEALQSDEAFRGVNVDGTLLLAREALRAGVQRFIHLSSTAAMGTPELARVDERAECHPTTPYGRSKRDAELGLLALSEAEGLDVVILRPCLVVGTGKRNSELLRMFRLVRWGLFPFFGKGAPQRKPLLHVSDLVRAMVLAGERGAQGEIYLVTSGESYSLEQVVQAAAELLGVRRSHLSIPLELAYLAAFMLEGLGRTLGFNPPLTRARLRLYTADREIDTHKIRTELGFEAQVRDPKAMLSEVFAEFREQGLI